MIATYLLAIMLAYPAADDAPPFPAAEAAGVGIDPAALERLKARAIASKSDAVVIVKDGRLIANWTFDKPVGPIEAMSVTKSVVNLAVGRLIDRKKIPSIDQLVTDFYPEWKQGRKQQITIRHLLNHTSGIEIPAFTREIYDSPDFVQYALAADLSDNPGVRFAYNNKAVNLLSGIVRKAAGKRMDVYIGEEIFKPMGITDFRWSLDDAGNTYALSGLKIRAIDLAKIGQMMLDKGTWRGHRIVSEDWVRLSTAGPGQPHDPTCGLLWWLIPGRESYVIDDAMVADYKEIGLTDDSLKKVEAIKGKEFDMEGIFAALRPILHADKVVSRKLMEIDDRMRTTGRFKPKKVFTGPGRGFEAMGDRGQYLVILPGRRIVAVRQLRAPENYSIKTDDFGEFGQMVEDLVADPLKADVAHP